MRNQEKIPATLILDKDMIIDYTVICLHLDDLLISVYNYLLMSGSLSHVQQSRVTLAVNDLFLPTPRHPIIIREIAKILFTLGICKVVPTGRRLEFHFLRDRDQSLFKLVPVSYFKESYKYTFKN